ncbi:MAG: hypothetical protein OXU81_10745 [Gammaproteobacteria bacterium]|nr:hypothetical protein [Gammaproteobacteria bacterium]
MHRASPAQTKIALFRSLFRGREDVWPRRFESLRTGKSGYAPACANEWRSGVCEKPRIKCAVCPNWRFLPVTDDAIRRHLTGADDGGAPFTMGVYPMLLDETCHLLAVDFDGKTWGDDASAYLSTCTRRGVPAALERSRSGSGGHVWLFFDTAVAAGLARRLGALLLTETMDGRPDLGFRSYDRFFPSQDTLPHGGFGNPWVSDQCSSQTRKPNTDALERRSVVRVLPAHGPCEFRGSLRQRVPGQLSDLAAVGARRAGACRGWGRARRAGRAPERLLVPAAAGACRLSCR